MIITTLWTITWLWIVPAHDGHPEVGGETRVCVSTKAHEDAIAIGLSILHGTAPQHRMVTMKAEPGCPWLKAVQSTAETAEAPSGNPYRGPKQTKGAP